MLAPGDEGLTEADGRVEACACAQELVSMVRYQVCICLHPLINGVEDRFEGGEHAARLLQCSQEKDGTEHTKLERRYMIHEEFVTIVGFRWCMEASSWHACRFDCCAEAVASHPCEQCLFLHAS